MKSLERIYKNRSGETDSRGGAKAIQRTQVYYNIRRNFSIILFSRPAADIRRGDIPRAEPDAPRHIPSSDRRGSKRAFTIRVIKNRLSPNDLPSRRQDQRQRPRQRRRISQRPPNYLPRATAPKSRTRTAAEIKTNNGSSPRRARTHEKARQEPRQGNDTTPAAAARKTQLKRQAAAPRREAAPRSEQRRTPAEPRQRAHRRRDSQSRRSNRRGKVRPRPEPEPRGIFCRGQRRRISQPSRAQHRGGDQPRPQTCRSTHQAEKGRRPDRRGRPRQRRHRARSRPEGRASPADDSRSSYHGGTTCHARRPAAKIRAEDDRRSSTTAPRSHPKRGGSIRPRPRQRRQETQPAQRERHAEKISSPKPLPRSAPNNLPAPEAPAADGQSNRARATISTAAPKRYRRRQNRTTCRDYLGAEHTGSRASSAGNTRPRPRQDAPQNARREPHRGRQQPPELPAAAAAHQERSTK